MALLISICKVKFTDETKDNCSFLLQVSTISREGDKHVKHLFPSGL